jgi:ribosomal protein S18 acetylase RimI-like enzyme
MPVDRTVVTIRPVRREDIEGAYGVLVDSHEGLYGEPQLTFGMFANLFSIGNGSIAELAPEVVGAAVVSRDFGYVWVRRSARRQGIATKLLQAAERDAGLGVLRFAAMTLKPAAAPFLAANGYQKVGEVWLMGIDLGTDSSPAPVWPDGIAVRSFDAEDAPAVKQLLDEAYSAEEPEYVPLSFEDWRAFMLGDPGYDPEVWLLAVAGGEIVAAALNWKDGYVKDLVVSPRWRRRGLGKALMLLTFDEFRRRGIPRVTLKTDSNNPTGAVRLYELSGMTIERTYEVFEKGLPRMSRDRAEQR